MNKLLTLLFCVFFPASALSQTSSIIDGNWDGFIEIEGEELAISLTFTTMSGVTDGAIFIPQQSNYEYPVEVTYLSADSLVFSYETGSGPAIFKASYDSNSPAQISGLFRHSAVQYPFMLIKENRKRRTPFGDHTEKEHLIDAEFHSIAGSLVTPNNYRDSTLVILVNGSGSQTRNGAVSGFEIFKELSMQLANHGYFSFRYDDRGTGKSTGAPNATLAELAEDLVQVSGHFSEIDQNSTFNSIVYIGYSQGGVVSLLASDIFNPRQIVLLSSPALPGDEIITQQIRILSDVQDIPEEIVEENLAFQERVYEAARTGSGWENLEQDIANRLRKQIEELPEAQQQTLGDLEQFIQSQVSRQLDGAKTRWFNSFIETDPRDLISNLRIPALAIFGENDTQVPAADNRAEIEQLNPDITTVTLENANHLFQHSDSGLPSEYGMLDRSFVNGLINEIVRFLDENSSASNRN